MNFEKNIFELRLNDIGIAAAQKFVRMTKWVLILVILQSLLSLGEAIVSLIVLWPGRSNYLHLSLFTKIFPFYTLLICISAIFQVYYYRKAGVKLSFSIDQNDEMEFNN